jgi:hypothetical protein
MLETPTMLANSAEEQIAGYRLEWINSLPGTAILGAAHIDRKAAPCRAITKPEFRIGIAGTDIVERVYPGACERL